MKTFRDVSIRWKLIIITMASSILALLFASSAVLTYEFFSYRGELVRDLASLVRIISTNSAAALTFHDRRSAEETLGALKARPHVVSAALYNADRNVFATYARDDSTQSFLPPAVRPDGYTIENGHIDYYQQVLFDGERIGTVFLRFELLQEYERLKQYAEIVAGVLLVSSLAALLLSSRLQRVISGPVLHLAGIAKSVSAQKDYSIRGVPTSGDELGTLVRYFNEMLEQIQVRDVRLQSINDSLERRVDERTQELQEEIVGHKRSERELASSLALVQATLESTADGILVVETSNKIETFNSKFVSMWRIPDDVIATRNDDSLLAFVLDQLKNPEQFIAKVRELYAHPENEDFDTLEFKDGRVFERSSLPMSIEGTSVGRVWSFRDVTDRNRAEEQIKSSLMEKEVLLKEIHHRVKNNMQVITSLLNLQAGTVADPHVFELLIESQNRVRSMALIHENLYKSPDLSQVNFGEYIGNLIFSLGQAYKVHTGKIAFTHDASGVSLRIDTAIPCGLIINELVSNAMKHAFPEGRSGTVDVRLFRESGSVVLRVSDTGVGLPDTGWTYRDSASLGLQLVNTLTAQLGGTINVTNSGGTTITIAFPA